MKTLYVVRHAKSSWEDPSLNDFDRPLNARGSRDAPSMGKHLHSRDIMPDLVLTSPALRALRTSELMAEVLKYPVERISKSGDLYHADEDDLLDIVRTIKDGHHTVLLVAHNPGLTAFVNLLAEANIQNVPTCGVAACELDIEHWKDADWGKGRLLFYETPPKKK
jgi:phosphohistidine phosphatase